MAVQFFIVGLCEKKLLSWGHCTT